MSLAKRMDRLQTERAFDVLARAGELEAQGHGIIHLEIGEPDFDTPEHIIEAACTALNTGHTHYCPAAGDPEFRKTVAEHVSRTRGVEYDVENVVVFPGGKPVIFLGILALVDAGDEVIFSSPGYPIYESVTNFVGGTPVPIVLREENDFRLDPAELADMVTDRTKLIVINSPQNPTGGVLTYGDLQEIARIAKENDLMVMSDETYESIIYNGQQHSIAAVEGMRERTLVMDCFSKSFAMTGWRLGFSASSQEVATALSRLMNNANSCTAAFTQRAGIRALQGSMEPTQKMVDTYRRRRDIMVDGLNEVRGICCLKPRGAFYAFPNITGTGYGSEELADLLMEQAHVAVLPGTAFGEHGEGYLRLSYANSEQNIKDALERMKSILGSDAE